MSETLKILVADDDPQMQVASTAGLSRRGDTIVVVPNGKDALAKLEAENFDLLITDQRMPEMTGLELLAALKGKHELPVIMITAHGTIDQAVTAMQAGATDFITKPFSIEDLIRAGTRQRVFNKLQVCWNLKGSQALRKKIQQYALRQACPSLQVNLGRNKEW